MVREDATGIERENERIRQRRRVNYFDYSFLFVIIFLICFGFLMLYSASSYSAYMEGKASTSYLVKQLIATSMGAVAMVFCIFFNYNFYRKFVNIIYFGAIASVFLVLTPIGIEANGARRWFDLGFVSVQPAEAVKLATIIAVAHLISINYKRLGLLKTKISILIYAFIGTAIVAVVTSNLSSAIIIFGIAVVMLFVASPDYKIFFVIATIFVVAVAVFIIVGKYTGDEFRFSRIQVWLNPEDYASSGGYQIMQGLYAIGSGGIWGKGLGQSVQKLGFIPEAQNDYIFTIICEELGLIGAISLIMLFMFIIRRMFVIAGSAPNLYGSMLVTGVMAHISIQVVLNIAVVTNSIPNTGVTLPFISYGGTSVLFLMAEVGIVLSVSRSIRRMR